MSSHHIDQTDSQASFNVCFTYKAKRINVPLPNHCVDGTILNTLIINSSASHSSPTVAARVLPVYVYTTYRFGSSGYIVHAVLGLG